MHEADAIVESDRDIAHAFGSLVGELCENGRDQALVLFCRFGPGRITDHRGFAHHALPFMGIARIRLLRASWVSSAKPSSSRSGGKYIPKRPR